MSAKVMTILSAVALVLLIGTLVMQVLEMQAYM